METHRDKERVTVRNFIVDDGLKIYSLQLELYGDVNEPERECVDIRALDYQLTFLRRNLH